jgi:hypothetical protein
MPCHPARARELVRRGRAYWVRRDTIKLSEYKENAVLQRTFLGIDAGAEHIGLAVVAEREKHKPRVIFRAQVEARPMREIKECLDQRRSYRRGRRSRKAYRRPWFSPTRRVSLSARLYNKQGEFLCRIPLAYGKYLTKPDKSGRPQAKRLYGNNYQLLTSKNPESPIREKKPGKQDILVYRNDGRLLTWYDPKRGDLEGIEKRLLGTSRRHNIPIASLEKEGSKKIIRLLSVSAEDAIPKAALPNLMPRFRKMGQKRKPPGWLSPSANSLLNAYYRGIKEIGSYVPISLVRLEVAAFDTQKLEDPTIHGVGYQKPALYAKQNRKDFVIARDGWRCVYCGVNNVPLTQDHIQPQSKGGPDRIGNLVACCFKCQNEKSNLTLDEFLKTKSPQQAKRIKEYVSSITQKNESLRSAAHVGQIKSKLLQGLIDLFGDSNVKRTWGYITKRDRLALHLPKSHDYDAIAIASLGRRIDTENIPPLRLYYMRRYTKDSPRRQKYKANPLSNAKKDNKNLAPLFIGQGSRSRWVQQVQVNSYAETPVGIVRLRDLIKTIDGRIGYVRKINSGRKPKPGQKPVRILTLSHKPQGKEGQFSTSANKVEKIIRRRRSLLEMLYV